jgi:phage terminase large subunit
VLDSAIYARELRDAQEEGRICSVPLDPTKPVSSYSDIGLVNQTAVWLVQHVAGEVRLIDFLQDVQRPFSSYLQELQGRGHLYASM